MKKLFFFSILLLAVHYLEAQQHQMSKSYVVPDDTLVRQKLGHWQDLKFGLFMHWGTYSQWGVVESWSICPEDEGWTQRTGPYGSDYFGYKKAYENLQTTFNPKNFHPEKWVKAAKEDGMRYKEVAEILNISPRTVQTQLFRAMKKLSVILASHQVSSKSSASSMASSPGNRVNFNLPSI